MKKDENKKAPESDNSVPILEMPPPTESPMAGVGMLFADDSVGVISAKFSMLESMLNLLTRDIKFVDFMRELLLSAMRIVKSEAGSILEVDHPNQTLFFRAVAGQSSDQLDRFTVPMGQGIVGHVAESRLPLVVSDAKENEKHLKSIPNAVGFEVRTIVAVPIVVRGQIFGVLELLNRIGDSTYSPGDVELLTYFCTNAAKAIELRLMLNWAKKSKGNAA